MRNRGKRRASALGNKRRGPHHTTPLALRSPRVGEGASDTSSAAGHTPSDISRRDRPPAGKGALPLCTPHQGAPGPGGGDVPDDAWRFHSSECSIPFARRSAEEDQTSTI